MMVTEGKVAPHTLNDLRVGGKIARLTRARKGHKCDACPLPIEKGADHYCVYIGGAGLGNTKFPTRCHVDCINDYLNIGGEDANKRP